MLFSSGNPYRGGLPEIIKLSPEDFAFQISPLNLDAIDHVAKWTVFVYMAADCDLAEPMFDDLMELKAIGSNEDVNICVLFDGPLLTDSFFARLNKDTSLEDDIIVRFADVHSDDVKVLQETITNTGVMYPSEKKLLILSGHGLGWQGALRDDSTWRQYLKRKAISLPPGDYDIYNKQLIDCYHKSLAEVRKRIRPEEIYRGSKFNIIAYDACNMGNIEALAFFFSHSEILIASENQVPGTGYPYDKILEKLKANPSQSPREFSQHLVKETKRYYTDSPGSYGSTEITQAAFDCNKFPEFFGRVQNLAKEMTDLINTKGVETIKGCIHNTWKEDGSYKDLRGLALNLLDEEIPIGLKKTVESLKDFLNNPEFVVEAEVPGDRYSPNEVSVYLPPPDKFDIKYLKVVNGLPPALRVWSLFLGMYNIKMLGEGAFKNPLVVSIQRTMAGMIQKGEYRPDS
jgi:hypothetical protein